jgi:hypothetical protein
MFLGDVRPCSAQATFARPHMDRWLINAREQALRSIIERSTAEVLIPPDGVESRAVWPDRLTYIVAVLASGSAS